MYEHYFKRMIDFCLSLCAIICFLPLLLGLLIIGAVKLKGNPLFFQVRPGKKEINGQEKLFRLIKLRTMTNEKDEDGNFLPDDVRLIPYGKWLRDTSLDELFELINILKGDMAIIGPRPQLVRDMVFMTDEQRRRHDVRPGLTGLAQISGRNNISWEQKFKYDLEYIDTGITLTNDIKILLKTIGKVIKKEDTVREGTVSDLDYGDWLLKKNMVSIVEYTKKRKIAGEILADFKEVGNK